MSESDTATDQEQQIKLQAAVDAQQIANEENEKLAETAEQIESEGAAKLWEAAERADEKSSNADEKHDRADAKYRRLTREAGDAAERARAYRKESSIYREFATELGKGR